MQVLFDKSGKQTVKFMKVEKDTLARAALILQNLGRCASSEEATKASQMVAAIVKTYSEESKS